jgi:hypothetical protein
VPADAALGSGDVHSADRSAAGYRAMNAEFAFYRWLSCCKPGMYLANLSLALGAEWANHAHIHADCVVDDFGTLQPVRFTGITATGELQQ